MELNYERLWKTLIRIGLKNRFSQIRAEFFMKLAMDGPSIFGLDDVEEILTESEFLKYGVTMEDMKDVVLPQLDGVTAFKHHSYHTQNENLFIEYFAKMDSKIILPLLPDNFDTSHVLDLEQKAICASALVDMACASALINTVDEDGANSPVTLHYIFIGETSDITPEDYPAIIKHELTHACLYELNAKLNRDWVTVKQTNWSDIDQLEWENDIDYLKDILSQQTDESRVFQEFICEFMMYESDGNVKIQNPVMKTREKPKKPQKPNRRGVKEKPQKPKITYKTINPYDRFQENISLYTKEYQTKFQGILNKLKSCYDDYDKFVYLTK